MVAFNKVDALTLELGTEGHQLATDRQTAADLEFNWSTSGRGIGRLSSIARRGVLPPELACSLTNLGNLVLRPKPDEAYVMNGAGCHDSARNRRCCTGVRHIEDYQDAGAFGSGAIH